MKKKIIITMIVLLIVIPSCVFDSEPLDITIEDNPNAGIITEEE